MTFRVITGGLQEYADVCNLLTVDPPQRSIEVGLGRHVTIPVDWLARCVAGEKIPGCTYASVEADLTTMTISDAAQTNIQVPANVTGVDPITLNNMLGKLGLPLISVPPDTAPRTSNKLGIIAQPAIYATSWQSNYVSLTSSAVYRADPAWWINYSTDPNGVTTTLRTGGAFVPNFQILSQVTPANCAAAVANAQRNMVLTFGEPELGTGEGPGNTNMPHTVAEVVDAWKRIVTDPAFLAHPEIQICAPYTAADQSTAGSFYRQFLAELDAEGLRPPDAIACQQYASYQFTPVQNISAITGRFARYHAAWPTLPIIGVGMSVLGNGSTIAPSDADVITCMQGLYDYFEAQPWMLLYSWYYVAPPDWLPWHAGQNMCLYKHFSDPPVRTKIGKAWWRLAHGGVAAG